MVWDVSFGMIWTFITYIDDFNMKWIVSIPFSHLHAFIYIVHSSRTMRNPTRRAFLMSGSKSTLLTLDTFILRPNLQTWTLLSISGMSCIMLFRRDLHHFAHLWICQLPCRIHCVNYLQVPSNIIRIHTTCVAAILCACAGPTLF